MLDGLIKGIIERGENVLQLGEIAEIDGFPDENYSNAIISFNF